MRYQINKANSRTTNNEPTLTDQSGARDTDINVIVAQYTIHGQVPGNTEEPMYNDWTDLPTDLRGFIELGRTLEDRRNDLPEAFRNLSIEELIALNREQILATLTPAEKPADNKDDKTT